MQLSNRSFISTRLVALCLGAICAGEASAGVTMQSIGRPLPPNFNQAHTVGAPSGTEVIDFSVGIKPRDLAGLQKFVADVSNPDSDNYRKFLTPAQVGQRFGASAADFNKIVTYLRSKGINVTLAAQNGMGLLASGTVSQIQSAFGITVKTVQGPSAEGKVVTYRTNTTAIKAPSDIAPKILDISGIDTFPRAKARGNTQTLTPFLARSLYEVQASYLSGYHGEGRVIGISNFDGYRLSNVPLFYQQFGLPTPPGGVGSNVQVIAVGQPAGPGNPGAEGDLDIQMALSASPLATLQIYDGSDLLSVVTKEANDNTSDVISESYGWILPGNTATAVHNQHLAMNAQGQTYLYASGDSGTSIEPYSYGNYDPEVLMVGGTVATVDDATGQRVNEVGWDGSGGGWSTNAATFNKRPAYQVGNGVPTNINFRLSPDVACQAGGPGAFAMFFNGQLISIDGTSCASPWFASGLVQMENRLEQNGYPFRLGRVNDLIYSLNGDSSVFRDITSGNNGTLPNGNSSSAAAGWDFVTGWGAPRFEGLYQIITASSNPGTTIDVGSAEVSIGSYSQGDVASFASLDGNTYDVDSTFIPQFGTASGIDATFTVPDGTKRMTVQVQAEGSSLGGTLMVWAHNFSSGNYDLLPASALTGSFPAKVIKLKINGTVANYIGPSNEVDLKVRGHYPVRPLSGFVPGPFTFKIDTLNLLAQ